MQSSQEETCNFNVTAPAFFPDGLFGGALHSSAAFLKLRCTTVSTSARYFNAGLDRVRYTKV